MTTLALGLSENTSPDEEADPFWVVTCFFNKNNDQRRRRNYDIFANQLLEQKVQLLTVELCPDAEFEGLPRHLSTLYHRINHNDELWSKEALLNIGIFNHLPDSCTKVCWLDCDIVFSTKRWARICSHLLDTHKVCQPFDYYVFLQEEDNYKEVFKTDRYAESFAHRVTRGVWVESVQRYNPGYGWAARREVLEEIGGLYTHAILGLADMVMAYGFHCTDKDKIGQAWDVRGTDAKTFMGSWSQPLQDHAVTWQKKACEVVKNSITAPQRGVVVHHLFHGTVDSRKYDRIGKVLQDFLPAEHVRVDDKGILAWTETAPDALKERVAGYFRDRASCDKTSKPKPAKQ